MIGEKLKELREKTGLNKKEFAQYLGLKYTTYNNYETESREPSSDFLILISEKFDVSIDYLLGLKDEEEVLHSYKLRSGEYEHITKYRSLDTDGRETVDYILNKEVANTEARERLKKRICTYAKAFNEMQNNHEKPILNAANERPDATDEGKDQTYAVMSNDSEWK